MRPSRVFVAIGLSGFLLLAACGPVTPSTAPSSSSAADVASAVASAVASDESAPPVTSTPAPSPDVRDLRALLPSEFRGTEAHTFAVGTEMLARVASVLALRQDDLEAAFASDHGPAFVQMYALRAPGRSAQEIQAALSQAAYPQADPSSVSVNSQQLGRRSVTVISHDPEADTIGTFYCLIDGSVLIVAQALAEPVAEAAFDELPTSPSSAY